METPSIYDSSYRMYLERTQREERKREFIDEKRRKMTAFGDSVSMYDLGDVARIREIEREADRRFE
ncbi:Uncharacterised protein [uncultured archaeon]|nr:Uncharacterised protein [uncultured archaeon]